MWRFVLAVLLCVAQADSQEFLSVSAGQVQDQPEATEAKLPEEKAVTLQEEKVIELKEDDSANPYVATGTTAECLALIFMLVACMICYLECCK
mmetsp:Transcript_101735/g.242621  ORF Transcript_101735/g.242621 Transcript_101735/m.242621 type:complete len:93 (-) Transcript_101735:80-358(-)